MKDFIFNIKSNLKTYNYIWKYKLVWCLPLILILVSLDWISKAIVVAEMKTEGTTATFIPGFINFSYIINPGAAYGMNAGKIGLAVSIAAIVTLMLIAVFIFIKNKYWLIPITLMVSGSIANLIARSWAPATKEEGIKGGVVDFLQFDFKLFGSDAYIFNLADAWVSIAVVIIIVMVLVYVVLEIIEYTMKRSNQEKYEYYCDIVNKRNLLFEAYYHSLDFKKEDKITYKEYLLKHKEISKEWKEYKNKG